MFFLAVVLPAVNAYKRLTLNPHKWHNFVLKSVPEEGKEEEEEQGKEKRKRKGGGRSGGQRGRRRGGIQAPSAIMTAFLKLPNSASDRL